MVGKWVMTLDDENWSSNNFGEFDSYEQLFEYINETNGEEILRVWQEEYESEIEDEDEAVLLYIGQVSSFVPSVNTDRILEDISENAYSEVGEYAEQYLYDVSKEHQSELEDSLNEVLHKWIEKYNYTPNFYTLDKVQSLKKKLKG